MEHISTELENEIKKIGLSIKELRAERGLSQTELAARIGVRQPIISRIEKGTHVPTWRNLERIARALDATLSISVEKTS